VIRVSGKNLLADAGNDRFSATTGAVLLAAAEAAEERGKSA
jgi:hypothetical protein